MYTLLVTNENTIITTIKERIVQRSKLCDNLRILIPIEYKEQDMRTFELTMLYELPVSKERYSIVLQKQPTMYKDNFIEYRIPADTWITKEAGDVKFDLTLSRVKMSPDSEAIQYVRKVTGGVIAIASCEDWASAVPDGLLQSLDQRIVALQMAAEQINEANQNLYDSKADNLSLEDNKLQLTAKGKKIGDAVSLDKYDNTDRSDGTITVVEF